MNTPTYKGNFYVWLPQPREIAFPFKLMAVGAVRTQPHEAYDFADHGHLEFCMRLNSEEPEARDEVDGVKYVTSFPHLFIKAPHCRHRYQVLSPREAIFFLYPSESIAAFDSAGIHMRPAALPFTFTPEFKALLEEFRNLYHRSQERGVPERFDLLAFQMLENIFLQQAPKEVEQPHEQLIRQIASYLQVNLQHPIRIKELCEKFAISRRNFFRYSEQLYHVTPARYIEEIKMREAVRLLTTRQLQVQEISDILGFDSPAYFIQTFRRRFDCTPRQFRLHPVSDLPVSKTPRT